MNQEQRIEWLRERKTYIGGSDIGCILGLSRFKTPLDIFLDKTTDRVDESMSEAAYWGRMFEDIVAKEYAKRTGHEIDRPDGLIRHKEHSFIAANIDKWVNGAGEVIATWRNVKPRQVLDTKKLQEEHQDIYQQYLSEKEAGRMFLVK